MDESNTERILINRGYDDDAFAACEKIKREFDEVNEMLIELEPYTRKLEKAVSSEDQKELTNFVEDRYKLLRKKFKTIEDDIKELEHTVDNAYEIDAKDQEELKNIVKANYQILANKLQEAQKFYSGFKTASKKKLTRQIRNLDHNNEFTEEQIDVMTEENPDAVNELVQQKLFGKASLKLQYEAQDIREKCDGIKRLQRDIRELLNMLKEISAIVQHQGEQIDSIGEHVRKAKDNVEQGNKNLVQAKKHHQDARCVS